MSMPTLPVPPIRPKIQKKLPPHPWPHSPVLELPSGNLRNHECGRLITMEDFVLGVGLSPKHFIFVQRAPGRGDVGSVMEQAVGFLCAHGASVFRISLRCRTSFFVNEFGQIDWRRCLVFFVRNYLSEDPTYPPYVPPQVWQVTPIAVLANVGQYHWREVEQIMEGVEAADPELLSQLGTSLTTMAARWERYLARQIILASKFDQYDLEERNVVAECDRQFYQLLTRFEPGYDFLPPTLARML